MNYRTLLLSSLLVPSLLSFSRGSTVTGNSPNHYQPVDKAALNADLKKNKGTGVSENDILRQSARMHGLRLQGQDAQPSAIASTAPDAITNPTPRAIEGRFGSRGTSSVTQSSTTVCLPGFSEYQGELGPLWDPIIGNPGYPAPGSVECIQKTAVPGDHLTLYTGMRLNRFTGQGVTVSSKFGPDTGVIVQYVIHDDGTKEVYHNYYLKSQDAVSAYKATLTVGDEITYDGVAPDSSCAANPECVSDPAKTGYQLQIKRKIKN